MQKRRKGNREDIAAITDSNGRFITDSIEKGNSLNFYYSSVFSCEGSISQMVCQLIRTLHHYKWGF
jgi:hypothetical protein